MKVLVVDDTKNIRMILTKCLELEGYEVTTANDGKKALELLAANTYDLVFLDIKLPEVRGTEVLRRIRRNGIKTPVVIITAYATVKNAVDCTNMGAVAYVQKPFSADKIKSVLRELDIGSLNSSSNGNRAKNGNEKPEVIEKQETIEKSEAVQNPQTIDNTEANIERLVVDIKSFVDNTEYDKALEAAKKALSIEINNPEIYLLISKAFKGLQKDEDAKRFYQLYKSYN